MSTKVKLKGRGSYLHIFKKAPPFEEGGQAKYKASVFVEKGSPDEAAMKKGYIAAAKKLFGSKWKLKLKKIKGNANKFCVKDGDAEDNDAAKGCWIVTASGTVRPKVKDADGKTDLAEDDGKPYSGCDIMLICEFFGYKQGGISASLMGVQFIRDNDAFGGGRPADDDDFDDLSDGSDDEDDEDSDDDADGEDEAPKKSSKKSAPVKKKKAVDEDDEDDEDDFDEDDAPPKKSSSKKSKPAPGKKKRPADDEDDDEMLDDEDDE